MKEVQPFIKTMSKNVIYKMSHFTGRSVKQISRDLCLHALKDKDKLAEELLPYLKWSLRIENNVYSPNNEPIAHYPFTGINLERVNVKIELSSFEFVRALAFSLAWSPAKVIAYCIERSMSDFNFLNQYIYEYLEVSMGENQKAIINVFMKEINKSLNEELSISAVVIDIMDEKASDQNANDALLELAMKW